MKLYWHYETVLALINCIGNMKLFWHRETVLAIINLCVHSENLEIRIWRENCIKYKKLKSWQHCVNHIFNQMALFFFLLTATTIYYHAICIQYLHNLHQLQAVKMVFSVLQYFLFAHLNIIFLAQNWTNLAKKLKVEFCRTRRTCFLQLWTE